jgi:hypothetical protein
LRPGSIALRDLRFLAMFRALRAVFCASPIDSAGDRITSAVAAGGSVAWDDNAKEVNEPDTGRYRSASRSKQQAMAWRRCACGSMG